ncbi:hypothetical protein DFQ26_003050 [Actinomortierella ambigua]|nr:hypothetical protein DFQ26_003050 [Actinomortierella ambigua]
MRTTSAKAGSTSAATHGAKSEFPLLRTAVFALANIAAAYTSLLKVPSVSTETPDESVIPALPTTLAVLFGVQTVLGLAQNYLSSSSSSTTAAASSSPSPSGKKQGGPTKVASKNNTSIVGVLSTSWSILLAGTAICHVFAVLFGAGLGFKAPETLMLSLYLSLLSFYPASFVLGYDLDRWLQVFIHNSPTTYTEAGLYCQGWMTILGAWLGSIVIPLDWDRPWQEWPVSCVLGAFGFYIIGTVVGVVVTVVMRQRAARRELGIVHKSQSKIKRS